ncbi:MAG: asparaginase [Actinomycetales bacterium]|nr:asparaginase [Actinomycetales bacterium]
MTAPSSERGAGTRTRVVLYTTGGTIASTDADGSGGVRPNLGGAALLGDAAGALGDIDLEVIGVRQVPSGELTLRDAIELSDRIRHDLDGGVAGVVIAQGTDTIEEFAFALDLLSTDGPVVVTGAMRHPGELGADGPANLAAAIRVASDPGMRDSGVTVVMNDEIHAARFVRKSDSSSPAAFASRTAGPIGRVVEGRVRRYVSPAMLARVIEPTRLSADVPAVALVTCALGDDGRVLERLLELGYAGVVVEGFGGGHVPGRLVGPLAALAGQVPVVLASRTGAGDTLETTYGYDGSERDLLGRGLISAGFLDGRKARVLLSLLLATGAPTAQVATAFATLHRSATGLA